MSVPPLARIMLLAIISLFSLTRMGVAPARADFPSELAPTDVERVARQYDCDIISIDGPTRAILLIPRGVRNNSDEKYHQSFHVACHCYVSNQLITAGAEPGFTQRFLVYAADMDGKQLMLRVSRLLILLWGQEHKRLHHDHTPDSPTIQVWLSPRKGVGLSPDIAGEQFKNQIYLYDVATERRAIEWLREVAHEYGHYAIPGISGFTEPEEWANGVLGERLYLKWFAEELKAGTLKPTDLPFVTADELNEYVAKQITPLIQRIEHVGATRAQLQLRDSNGMDTYTALALYIDSTYGTPTLLRSINATTPAGRDLLAEAPDFYNGFIDAVTGTDTLHASSQAVVKTDSRTTFTFYLREGKYGLHFNVPTLEWLLRPISNSVKRLDQTSFVVLKSGWYQITVTAPPTLPVDPPLSLSVSINRTNAISGNSIGAEVKEK